MKSALLSTGAHTLFHGDQFEIECLEAEDSGTEEEACRTGRHARKVNAVSVANQSGSCDPDLLLPIWEAERSARRP